MSDIEQRIADGEQAKQAYERYILPALNVMRADYMAKLTEEAVKPMEGRPLQVVQNLSLALRVAKEVEAQMKSLVLDGEAAYRERVADNKLANLGTEAQRFARY